MQTVNFFSPSGGVGTTTLACSYALHVPTDYDVVWVGVDDGVRQRAVHGIIGAPTDSDDRKTSTLVTSGSRAAIRVNVTNTMMWELPQPGIQIGTTWMDGCVNILVVTPDYVRLSEALRHLHENGVTQQYPDRLESTGVVVFRTPNRVLTDDDVTRALGVSLLHSMPYDAAVPRAIDAGLLPSRIPQTLRLAVEAVESFVVNPSVHYQGDNNYV